jgi:hypothetical protein
MMQCVTCNKSFCLHQDSKHWKNKGKHKYHCGVIYIFEHFKLKNINSFLYELKHEKHCNTT